MSFAEVGVEIDFRGKGADEKGYVVSCSDPDYQLREGSEVVAIDTQYYRPTEVDLLIGDPTKAQTKLGWRPRYDLGMLVKEMMAADVEFFTKEKILKEKGYILKKHFE
jgi:GDPmannose 4,6-dehydratase